MMTLGQVTTTALTLLAAFATAFRQDELVQDPSRLVELHSPPEVEDSLSFEYMEVLLYAFINDVPYSHCCPTFRKLFKQGLELRNAIMAIMAKNFHERMLRAETEDPRGGHHKSTGTDFFSMLRPPKTPKTRDRVTGNFLANKGR